MDLRERFIHCLADMASNALRASDLDAAMPRLLARLGEAAQVSRVYTFRNHLSPDGRRLATQHYEWCQHGIASQLDNPALQAADYESIGLSRWAELLSQGQSIASHVADLPASERPGLEAQGILSILVLPLFVQGDWYGFIGFDACEQPHAWQPAEIELLRAAAGIIASFLERHETERQLRLTQSSIDNAPDAIYWLSADGRITYANASAHAMLGCPRLLERSLFDFAPTLSTDQWMDFWESLRRSGQFTRNSVFQRQDGLIFPVEISARFFSFEDEEYVMAFVRDITERRRAEEALRASEERLRRITEQASISVWTLDADLRITYHSRPLSRRLRERFGPCGLVGRSASEILRLSHDSNADMPELSGLRRALAGETVHYGRYVGDQFIEDTYSPLRDAAGAISGVIATSIDVTERHNLETQMAQAQRMEALGRLASGVAHDFRSILTGIIGNLSFIEAELPAHLRPILHEATQAAQRAAGLTRQLLAFASESPVSLQPLDLNLIIREAATLARAATNPRIELTLDLSPDLPAVNADPQQIHRVLMNLLINASEAIQPRLESPQDAPSAFRITVTSRPAYLDNYFAEIHPGRRPGKYALVAISDNGIGMDANSLQRLFEPFFTTKTAAGVGLGLSICHGIISQHGGWIEAESVPGQGSTLYVYLPSTESDVAKESASPQTTSAPALPTQPHSTVLRGGTETILLADDEEIVRKTGRRILERFGYTVLLASDGQAVIDLYQRHAAQIELVILDHTMPAFTSTEILGYILTLNPRARVIISSGYTSDGSVGELLLRGAIAHLPKPYRLEELVSTVREILDRPLTD